jgi:transposase
MTRQEVVLKAVAGSITWLQAADILGCTPRHIRRLHWKYKRGGVAAFLDRRGGKNRRGRVPMEVVEELFRLRREKYPDFSVAHFHEHVTERHGLKFSYTFCKRMLQDTGLAQKAPGRGKYRRRRERRPLVGMLLHMDASTHAWLPELPLQDLNVVLDDADGRILHARFVEQEGTHSTLLALSEVLHQRGRFCELYTDRGSHFAHTTPSAKRSPRTARCSASCERLASATFWPAPRRHVAGASVLLAPSRADSPRSCVCTASRPTRRPTGT